MLLSAFTECNRRTSALALLRVACFQVCAVCTAPPDGYARTGFERGPQRKNLPSRSVVAIRFLPFESRRLKAPAGWGRRARYRSKNFVTRASTGWQAPVAGTAPYQRLRIVYCKKLNPSTALSAPAVLIPRYLPTKRVGKTRGSSIDNSITSAARCGADSGNRNAIPHSEAPRPCNRS